MKLIDKNDIKSKIDNNDFVYELKNYLCGYLEKINVEYYIQKEKLTLDELVDPIGLLPILLYNLEDLTNNYLKKINEETENNFFIKVYGIYNGQSLINYELFIEHNLILNNGYTIDKQHYYNFIKYALKEILSQKILDFKDNAIHLDETYTLFYSAILNPKVN